MAKSRLTTQSTVLKTLDNNGLNQVVASSGFSENKGLAGMLSLTAHNFRIFQQYGISLGSEEI